MCLPTHVLPTYPWCLVVNSQRGTKGYTVTGFVGADLRHKPGQIIPICGDAESSRGPVRRGVTRDTNVWRLQPHQVSSAVFEGTFHPWDGWIEWQGRADASLYRVTVPACSKWRRPRLFAPIPCNNCSLPRFYHSTILPFPSSTSLSHTSTHFTVIL
jgi:hypothetical protein